MRRGRHNYERTAHGAERGVAATNDGAAEIRGGSGGREERGEGGGEDADRRIVGGVIE